MDLKQLQTAAKNHTILYAEDNEALRLNATKLLNKFFSTVYSVSDGQEALESFKKNPTDILITDIKMPNMDGLELATHIKTIAPQVKTIVMSAFDEKEFLHEAIKIGVFRYLTKPVNVTALSEVLYEALLSIRDEYRSKIFQTHLESVFNYQSSMVLMLKNDKPIIANKMFLEFFELESVEEFNAKYKNLGVLFLEHDGFLYEHDDVKWFDVVTHNDKKLFHVKLQNLSGEIKHLIIKYQSVPHKESYGILSFDDVTELNLLKLFDRNQTQSDNDGQDMKAMFDLLEVIQRNSAKIAVHNYYKGLSITNDGIIVKIENEVLTIKTNFLQQKAIQFEKKVYIVSDALPHTLECSEVLKIEFDTQSVSLKNLKFVLTSPVKRKTIRVIPEENHTVSLFIRENKFYGDVIIEDISLDAIKLKLNALPAGIEKGDEVNLDIVVELDKRPLIINTKAKMFRKSESRHSFSLVFLFNDSKKSELVKYITKRQMAMIREFKGLQNG